MDFDGFESFRTLIKLLSTLYKSCTIWKKCSCSLLSFHHRVDRVLSFFSSRWNWNTPPPHPQASVCPSPGGGAHSLAGGGPNSNEGTCTVALSRYICTLVFTQLPPTHPSHSQSPTHPPANTPHPPHPQALALLYSSECIPGTRVCLVCTVPVRCFLGGYVDNTTLVTMRPLDDAPPAQCVL